MLLCGDLYGVVPPCAGGVCLCALLNCTDLILALSASVLRKTVFACYEFSNTE